MTRRLDYEALIVSLLVLRSRVAAMPASTENVLAAAAAAVPGAQAQDYGKLVFLGKEGQRAQEYPINKSIVVLGR